jgi:hypothetical protein
VGNGNDSSSDWGVVTQSIEGLSKTFSSLLVRLERKKKEKEKGSPHNCLSPLPDKTATANNAWDLVNQTTLFLSLSLSLSLPCKVSPTLSVSSIADIISSNSIK